jgi:hypothetical protein
MLEEFTVAKFRFALEPIEPMSLPSHKGGTLRGGFGQAFKRMTCSQPRVGYSCKDCQARDRCAYSYVFETPVPPDSEVLRTHEAVPRPFAFEPPRDGKTAYDVGEELDFGLVLVGRGIEYFPYFVLAFKALGEMGLGRGRGRFRLNKVWACDPLGPWETLVYDGPSDALRNSEMTRSAFEIEQAASTLPSDELSVEFLTPTLLKHSGKMVREPEFHVLARGLLRRLSSLYYFHCGERWEADYRGLVELAESVETVEKGTHWQRWERYSGKQDRCIDMGGIVGKMHYTGPLGEFRPLLLLGSVVHVGKGCVFGNGKYAVA